jgi:hypothetical protein
MTDISSRTGLVCESAAMRALSALVAKSRFDPMEASRGVFGSARRHRYRIQPGRPDRSTHRSICRGNCFDDQFV